MYLCVRCSVLDRCSGIVVLAKATRRRRYPRQNYGSWRWAATTTRRHSIRRRIVPPVTLLHRRLYSTTALSRMPARCHQSPANWSRRQPVPLTPRLSVLIIINTGWAKNRPDFFRKFITPVCDDIDRHFIGSIQTFGSLLEGCMGMGYGDVVIPR